MVTMAIDTYKTINNLKTKGFTTEQAEGIIEALSQGELVDKSYLDLRLAETKTDLIKWIAAMLIAQSAAIVALQTLVQ